MGLNKPVGFSTAKLLKEKGFDEECKLGWYLPHSEIAIKNNIEPNTWQLLPIHFLLNQIKAPTIADVIVWLYEKYGIWIGVLPQDKSVIDYRDNKNTEYPTLPYFISIVKYEKDCTMKEILNSSDEKSDLFLHFDSFTEAYEKAIEYTLTKLI